MTATRFLQTISFDTEGEDIACAYEPWFDHIIGSNHLLALSVPACTINPEGPFFCLNDLPVANWTALRHLEISFALHGWVSESLLTSLRQCPLESLRLVNEFYERGARSLSAIRFEGMPSLKYVDLHGCFPAREFTLPEACRLCLTLTGEDLSRKSTQWKGWAEKIAQWGSVLDLTHSNMKAWPPGIQQLPNLQYLELRCEENAKQGLDLAALKHIPNISLYLRRGVAELCLSSGSWKSMRFTAQASHLVI